MEEGEQALERGERGGARRGLVLVEPRLDRLGVPVAEVVEREVVEHVRRGREVERAPTPPRPAPARDRSGPGSSAPRARSARRPARCPRRSGGSAARRSRACSRACGPPRSRPGEKRTSWVDEILSSPYRVASAPWASIISSGSTPVPRLFDIRRPSAASTVEWMITSVNGTSPISSSPAQIIRFSHSRMISRAVELTLPG